MTRESPGITPERLAAVKARLAKATPGPWRGGIGADDDTIVGPEYEEIVGGRDQFFWSNGDYQLLLHSRDDLDALVAEVERLRLIAFGTEGEPKTPEDHAKREKAIVDMIEGMRRDARAEERAAIVAYLKQNHEGATRDLAGLTGEDLAYYRGEARAYGDIAREIAAGDHLAAPAKEGE